jgi:hypothetical protein
MSWREQMAVQVVIAILKGACGGYEIRAAG